jgi:hypothetical protein
MPAFGELIGCDGWEIPISLGANVWVTSHGQSHVDNHTLVIHHIPRSPGALFTDVGRNGRDFGGAVGYISEILKWVNDIDKTSNRAMVSRYKLARGREKLFYHLSLI